MAVTGSRPHRPDLRVARDDAASLAPTYRPLQGRFGAACRYCHGPVLWLRHPGTNRLAPIDAYPDPTGNIEVLRDNHGRPAGTYVVHPAPVVPARVRGQLPLAPDDLERAAEGEAEVEGYEASPTLHLNHWVTCPNVTARRFARERARSARRGQLPAVPRTVDGDLVGQRWDDVEDTRPAPAPAPAAVATRRCRRCLRPLAPDDAAAGERYHPTCDPEGGFS